MKSARMLAKPVLPVIGATGQPQTLRLCALLALLEGSPYLSIFMGPVPLEGFDWGRTWTSQVPSFFPKR